MMIQVTLQMPTLNTISVTHGTTTSAVVVTSALAADGTKASLQLVEFVQNKNQFSLVMLI